MILVKTPAHTGNKIDLDVFCNTHFNDWFYCAATSVSKDFQIANIDELQAAYSAHNTFDEQSLPSLDEWITNNDIDTRYGNTIHIVSITPVNNIVLSGNAVELIVIGTPNAVETIYINGEALEVTIGADGRMAIDLTVTESGVVYIVDDYGHVAKVEVV